MEIEMIFDASTESISAARRFARRTLEEWDRRDLVEPAELLVSELVGNAVMHAGTWANVRLRLEDGRLHVEVTDGSTEQPALQAVPVDSASGRGLVIVDALADDWGVDQIAGGKVIWFDLGP